MPHGFPSKILIFLQQNGTTDGIYEVDAGVPSPSKIGHLYTWNNMTEMPEGTWDTKYARMINGTDGQLFSPMLKREDRLTIFVPQICRSIQMEYTKDVAVNGVPSWRYAPPLDLYDPALPQNRAFCNKNGMPRYFDNTTVQIGERERESFILKNSIVNLNLNFNINFSRKLPPCRSYRLVTMPSRQSTCLSIQSTLLQLTNGAVAFRHWALGANCFK